jgi:ABC-type nitrate/sulfonate/bicarbonate transport system substrate-binding protein
VAAPTKGSLWLTMADVLPSIPPSSGLPLAAAGPWCKRMLKWRNFPLLIASGLRLSVAPQGPRLAQPVALGLISEGTNTWPLYVAQGLGLFKAAGIEVTTSVVGSSVLQQERLIAGEYDIGLQQPDHVVRAVGRGSDLFIFMAHGHAPELTLVALPGLAAVADLRGRRIAVDGARTGYALLLRRLLERSGIAPEEVEFREVGGSRERFEALQSAAVAASLLNPPFDAKLLASGYSALAQMSECFPDYPGSVGAARRAWARAHPDALIGFIRAFDAAYAWLAVPAHREEALSMLPAHLSIAAEAAAAALTQFHVRPRPEIAVAGLEQVVETVWAAEGRADRHPPAERYVDLTFRSRALDHPLRLPVSGDL